MYNYLLQQKVLTPWFALPNISSSQNINKQARDYFAVTDKLLV